MLKFIASSVYYLIYSIIVLFVYLFSRENVSEPIRKKFFAEFFTSPFFVKWCKHMLNEERVAWLKDFTNLKSTSNEKLVIILLNFRFQQQS